MLKAFIIVFCVYQFSATVNSERVAVKFDEEITKYLLGVIKGCISKTGADPSVVDIIRNGKVTEDQKFKEFFYCACTETGLAHLDGKVKVKESIDMFPKDVQSQVLPVMRLCVKENGVDKYDTLFKFMKCFQVKSPVRVALI